MFPQLHDSEGKKIGSQAIQSTMFAYEIRNI